MKLEAMALVKEAYGKSDGEAKADAELFMKQAIEYLGRELPALADYDRACVAWFVAELVTTLRYSAVREVDDKLRASATGYSMAAVKLAGLLDGD